MKAEDKTSYIELLALYDTLTPEEADKVLAFIRQLQEQRQVSE